ncbi:MAG: hypothetical protein ACI910_002880 [Oleispira sp.]|jgi:hypothetical protein
MGYQEFVSLDEGKVQANAAVNTFTNKIIELAPRVKNFGFHEEVEWRIVATDPDSELQFRAASSHLIPYIHLPVFENRSSPIKEIIVGPNPNSQRCISSIEKLVQSFNLERVEVNESQIPFSSW